MASIIIIEFDGLKFEKIGNSIYYQILTLIKQKLSFQKLVILRSVWFVRDRLLNLGSWERDYGFSSEAEFWFHMKQKSDYVFFSMKNQ